LAPPYPAPVLPDKLSSNSTAPLHRSPVNLD